jgi:hypothetical protein
MTKKLKGLVVYWSQDIRSRYITRRGENMSSTITPRVLVSPGVLVLVPRYGEDTPIPRNLLLGTYRLFQRVANRRLNHH